MIEEREVTIRLALISVFLLSCPLFYIFLSLEFSFGHPRSWISLHDYGWLHLYDPGFSCLWDGWMDGQLISTFFFLALCFFLSFPLTIKYNFSLLVNSLHMLFFKLIFCVWCREEDVVHTLQEYEEGDVFFFSVHFFSLHTSNEMYIIVH